MSEVIAEYVAGKLKNPPQMRLYVWDGIYCDYSCGGGFAIATSLKKARALMDKAGCGKDHNNTKPKVFNFKHGRAYAWSGGG